MRVWSATLGYADSAPALCWGTNQAVRLPATAIRVAATRVAVAKAAMVGKAGGTQTGTLAKQPYPVEMDAVLHMSFALAWKYVTLLVTLCCCCGQMAGWQAHTYSRFLFAQQPIVWRRRTGKWRQQRWQVGLPHF